jgi:hypothetical protein
MVAVPGALALIAATRRLRGVAAIAWIGLPLLVLAVVTSQARSAVVGTVIAALAFLALIANSRRGLAALLGIVVIGAASFLVVSPLLSRSASANRYSSIAPAKVISTTFHYREATLALIPTYAVDYPFGAGMGSVGPAGGSPVGGSTTSGLDAESEFTFLEIELGLPGLVVLLCLSLAGVRFGLLLRRVADPGLQRVLMALTAALIALLASWVIGAVSPQSPTAPFFWLATGALAYWYGEMRAGRLALRARPLRAALAAH